MGDLRVPDGEISVGLRLTLSQDCPRGCHHRVDGCQHYVGFFGGVSLGLIVVTDVLLDRVNAMRRKMD